jgi:hypothetical protein
MIPDLITLQVDTLAADSYNFFDTNIVNLIDFLQLVIRFTFNLVVVAFMVRGLYFPIAKRKDYLFSFLLISNIVFLLCFLLGTLGITIGAALGLFAIFGIIRYRTNTIPIKEMTYLFVVIGISVINALAKISYVELLFTNLAIIVLIFFLEKLWLLRYEISKTIVYEKIELIKPELRQELIDDLKKRTGLNIHRIEIGRINLLRDTVRIRVFYMENGGENHNNIEIKSQSNR